MSVINSNLEETLVYASSLLIGQMHLGDPAPDFTAWSTLSKDEPLHFHKWIGNDWCILFSHPADFTPVCTTELAAVARLQESFAKLGCKVVGLSTDGVDAHFKWSKDIDQYNEERHGHHSSKCTFPIIADEDLAISKLYGMLDSPLHDPTNINSKTGMPLTVRTVFIIDPQKKVRLMLTYPATVGRSFDEIFRCVEALIRVDARQVATPANWIPGELVIVRANVPDDVAMATFSSIDSFKPYLRFVEDQNPQTL